MNICFDSIILIDDATPTPTSKVIYSSSSLTNIDSIQPKIAPFCFPYPETPFPLGKTIFFVFCIIDADKNISYCFNSSVSVESVRRNYVLISPYYHPDFFSKVITIVSDVHPTNESKALDFIKSISSIPLHKRVYDWFVVFSIETETYKIGRLLPETEIGKLYEFIFTQFSIVEVLSLIVSIMNDHRIVFLSADVEILSKISLAALALIYPMPYPGTFIPLIPFRHLTAMEAPFAYIIGLHSSLSTKLLDGSIEEYFFVEC